MTAAFVLGFVLGGLVGVLVMALCAVAGDSDDDVTPINPKDFGPSIEVHFVGDASDLREKLRRAARRSRDWGKS